MIALHHGDCLDVLPTLAADSVDTCITDPPYGLSFMGKDWDHGVPGERFWREVLRVLKPGAMLLAFGGTRTHHRLMVAIEDAGFELRDVVMWVYGCLSEDTEILTVDGWKTYEDLACGSMVMCYNVNSDSLELHAVEEVFTYDYSDTAYSIKSDSTDQLVSRNHRCLVERNGTYAYETAEKLRDQETVPVLEYLPGMREDILAGGILDKESKNSDLQLSVQRSIARQGMGEARTQRAGGLDFGCRRISTAKDDRTEQSGVEGWGDVLQDTWKLSGRQIRALPTGIQSDGAQGWLCDGASADCGATSGALPEAVRGSASHRPRSNKQRPRQSDAIQEQQPAQAIRGGGATSPSLATVTPTHYEGVVWCVRVPTGAFVARRNGHAFVTGNSGFPKSANISKLIDKAAGAAREVVGIAKGTGKQNPAWNGTAAGRKENSLKPEYPETIPATDAAALWDGWGTALKPAWEPIIVAMKPRDGTFAHNALTWGVAGLNVDGARVGTTDQLQSLDGSFSFAGSGGANETGKTITMRDAGLGRWPANFCHDGSEEVMALFPSQSSPATYTRNVIGHSSPNPMDRDKQQLDRRRIAVGFGDTGSAARFFYCAKASRSERNAGCEGMEERRAGSYDGNSGRSGQRTAGDGVTPIKPTLAANGHPTVKPLALMRYLCRLTATPTGGTVLDPFAGSGSTGCAAILEGRDFIGIDLDADYVEIARRRIAHWQGVADAEAAAPRQLSLEEPR